VEYFIKENMNDAELKEMVHLCCTSEDINNLAYALMLDGAFREVILPVLQGIQMKLADKSVEWAGDAMLAHTHGQPATPTTLGKEMANFVYRIKKQTKNVEAVRLTGKMNGATGNYNSHYFSYP
jgi:adenylosuccinate lyase